MLTTLLAQTLTRDDLVGLENEITPGFGGRNLAALISYGQYDITTALFWIAGTLLLFYLIFGGFKLMTSSGDPKKAAGAQQTITHALLGMLIVFTAYWVVQIIGEVLGLNQVGGLF